MSHSDDFDARFQQSRPQRANGQTTFSKLAFRDITPQLDAGDFVQGLITDNSLAVVYGKSNSGKTFWCTTLGLHVAAGREFAGRQVDQSPVLYVALEGGFGFRNRVVAWRDEHGLGDYDLPFFATTTHLNLLDPNANLDDFIGFVHSLGKVRLVIIDTLFRALSGGNENAPDDMGQLVMNADRIRHETGTALLFVHHSGKDELAGSRGHSSLQAAADTEIEVADLGDGSHTATVAKQRDLAKGQVIAFSLRTVELGTNPRGDPVTSCVVEFNTTPPSPRPPLKGQQKQAFEILCDLLAAPWASGSVHEDRWRQEFYDRAMPAAERKAKEKAFHRASAALVEQHRITLSDHQVRLVARSKVETFQETFSETSGDMPGPTRGDIQGDI